MQAFTLLSTARSILVTDERRRTGSHYTPRSLTEPIVRYALEPAFERLGPDATPVRASLVPFFASPIPARSPMGAYRALVAKCAPDGFRESLARFRADRPPNQPHICWANP